MNELHTIVCYGDSNTYGYNPNDGMRYPREVRWVNILAKALGDNYHLIPEGLNGRTTMFDREGEPWKNGLPYLKPCLATHRPMDWLVFMLGTNDCCTTLGLTAEQIADGMEHLILDSREILVDKQGYLPKTIIVAPAAIRSDYHDSPFIDKLDDYTVEKSHALAPLYKALADKYDCIFVDATDVVEVSPLDSLHLTERGHAQLAEMLYQAIKK